MTQISSGGQNPPGQGAAGSARERAFADGRLADPRSSTASQDTKLKPGARTASTSAIDDRSTVFERSLRRHTATEGSQPCEAKLLATAEWSASAFTMPLPQPPAADSDAASVTLARTFVSTIAARIEQAVRADLIALASGPTTVAIDLGGLVPGLQQVSITMGATTLDVTFDHALVTLPEELVQATQALAEQLARRFAGRSVRILQAAAPDAEADARAESGLQAISGLLGRAAEKQ